MKKNSKTKENIMLLIGITIFMFFYYLIKKQIDSSIVFVLISLFYLVFLKIFSKYLSKKNWPFWHKQRNMLLIAIIIGTLVGIYGVYAVVFVYKYKGTPKAGMVRILGVSSVAIVASFGSFLIQYFFGSDTELSFNASIAFTASGIISMVIFFWINRNKIEK